MMDANGSALLRVENLEVVYNHAITAVQGVSLRIPERAIVAVLGVNGAGKTTTLRAISGFIGSDNAEITNGVVEFAEKRLIGMLPQAIARRGIALVAERRKIFPTLTVKQNLRASVAGGTGGAKERIEQIHRYFPVLRERSSQVAGYLSGGERQMLAIGMALLSSPRLLLVDELSLGLSPLLIRSLMDAVRAMRDDLGLTVMLVEQNAAAALRIADYGYVMENGRMVFEGTPEQLAAHEDVREFYLGTSGAGDKSYRDVKQYRRTRRWFA